MNAKQRRKSKRLKARAPFSLEFTQSNQRSVSDCLNNWASIASGGAGGSSDRHAGQSGCWYPVEILNPDGSKIEPAPAIIDMNISFDFSIHEQPTAQEKLA